LNTITTFLESIQSQQYPCKGYSETTATTLYSQAVIHPAKAMSAMEHIQCSKGRKKILWTVN